MVLFEMYPIESVVLPKTQPTDLPDTPATGQAMARRHWHEWIDITSENSAGQIQPMLRPRRHDNFKTGEQIARTTQ